MRKPLLAALLAAIALPAAAQTTACKDKPVPPVFEGTAFSGDGDNVYGVGFPYSIRLWGLNAPELRDGQKAETVPGNAALTVSRYAFETFDVTAAGCTAPNFYRGTSYDAVAMYWALRGTAGGLLNVAIANEINTINSSTGANSWGGTGTHSCVGVANANGFIVAAEQLIAEYVCAASQAA